MWFMGFTLFMQAAVVMSCSLALGSSASAAPPNHEIPDSAVNKHVVLMLPLEVEGELSEQGQRDLVTQMHAGFEHAELSVVSGRTAAAPACNDDACLREFGREQKADYVISTRITAGARDYRIELRTLPVAGERSATTTKIECPVCGIAEVSDQIAAKARIMRDWVLADIEPAQLRIEGSPASAAVSIDGEPAGTVPFVGELSPGEHEIIVSAPNYRSKQLPFNAIGGAAVQMVIELVAEPLVVEPPADPDKPKSWRLPVAGAALGVGVIGLITGATFLAIDGRPIGSRCDDPANVDADGDCKFMYTSVPAGIGLAVGGAVVAGVGIGLLVVELRQHRNGSPTARVGVGLGLDQATLRVDF